MEKRNERLDLKKEGWKDNVGQNKISEEETRIMFR